LVGSTDSAREALAGIISPEPQPPRQLARAVGVFPRDAQAAGVESNRMTPYRRVVAERRSRESRGPAWARRLDYLRRPWWHVRGEPGPLTRSVGEERAGLPACRDDGHSVLQRACVVPSRRAWNGPT